MTKVSVRLTSKERDTLKYRALMLGVKPSDLIRRCLWQGGVIEHSPDMDRGFKMVVEEPVAHKG